MLSTTTLQDAVFQHSYNHKFNAELKLTTKKLEFMFLIIKFVTFNYSRLMYITENRI